jgi:hypothetical protein
VAVAAALVVELPRHPQGARSESTQSQGPQPQVSQPSQPEVARDVQQPNTASVEQAAASKPEPVSTGKVSSDKSVEAARASRASGPATSAMREDARLQQPNLRGMETSIATLSAANLSTKKERDSKQPAEEAKPPVLLAGAVKQDYVANYLFADDDTKLANYKNGDLPPAPAPQPGISQLGLAAAPPAQIPSFSGIPANVSKKSVFHRLNPLTPVEHLGCILCKVVDVGHLAAKTTSSSPAITSSGVALSAMDVHGKVSSSLLKDQPALAAAPAKSASGELGRSEGAFRRAAAAPAGTRLRGGASAQMHWKVEEGKLFKSIDQDQWQDAYPRDDTNFEFSFVAVHGADVWAGGTHAALLHSRDGGTMWENLKLSDSASGTIVSIVANGLNVEVKTSDNQTWSSPDAGKTWIPQNGQN